jgi:tetratricopeptide (TPR) repeat protein
MPQLHEPACCLAFGIDQWATLSTTQRIRVRAELAGDVRRMCEERGEDRIEHEFSNAGNHVVVLRGWPSETLSELVQYVGGQRGLRMTGVAGMAGAASAAPAIAEALRTFRVVRQPHGLLPRVVLSEVLYRDYADAMPPGFQPVEGKGFGPYSWVWPMPPPADGRSRRRGTRSAFAAALCWAARRLMGRGRYEKAASLLQRALRAHPRPAALLALGECLRGLGRLKEAAIVSRELIRRRPLSGEAYLLAGTTEERPALANTYLAEGLRIIQNHPWAAVTPTALTRDLLLASARLAYRWEDQTTGDTFVNEAATVDPYSAGPWAMLAVQATREGNIETARLLLAIADVRDSGDQHHRNGQLWREAGNAP